MMFNRLGIVMAMALFLGNDCSRSLHASESKRIAILVGIDQYPRNGFAQTKCVEKDVAALSKEFEKLQFKVVTLAGSVHGEHQATRANIETTLETALAEVGKDDVVVVGLFGQGRQFETLKSKDESQTYFCPVDAISDDPKSMFSIEQLLENTLGKRGSRNVVLIDVCRNIEKDASENPRGIDGRLMKTPDQTAVFFSCRAGQKSYEDPRQLGHGLFAYGILKSLRDLQAKNERKPLCWFELIDSILVNQSSSEIEDATPRESVQEPILIGNLQDFVFSPGDSNSPVAVTPSVLNQNATGVWRGKRVNSGKTPIELSIVLIQQGSAISGLLHEANASGELPDSNLYSTIDGWIKGDGSLTFTKTNEGRFCDLPPVTFRGKISDGGKVFVDGTWVSDQGQAGTVSLERVDAEATTGLTSVWHGSYFYPEGVGQPEVDFQLFAIQKGDSNQFVGFIKEPNTFGSDDTAWLYATVKGKFEAETQSIKYTKKYDGTGRQSHEVKYSARLSKNGKQMIEGQWNLGEGLGGAFTLRKLIP